MVKRLKVINEDKSLKQVSEEDISKGMLGNWVRKYLKFGEQALINKKKPGNPLAKYSNRKKLTEEEQPS